MKNQASIELGEEATQRDDRQLVVACLEGDSAAWEALIARYQRLIYSIPIKSRLSADDAADIFQSVCLKLYEKLSSLRDHERISSWLITTTTREAWRIAARNRRDTPAAGSENEDGADLLSQIAAQGPLADEQRQMLEQQQIVRQALEALPERCRDLVTMLFYEKDE